MCTEPDSVSGCGTSFFLFIFCSHIKQGVWRYASSEWERMKLLQQMGKCENRIMTTTRRSKEATGAMRKEQAVSKEKRLQDLKVTSERGREWRRRNQQICKTGKRRIDYEFANCPRQDKSTAPGSSDTLKEETKSGWLTGPVCIETG